MKEFKTKNFHWLDVENPTKEKIEELTKKYNLYRLDTEDCQIPTQKPKLVEHNGYLFLILKFPLYLIEERETEAQELDIFVGKDYLITFHSGKIPPYNDFLKSITEEQIVQNYHNTGSLLYFILRKLHVAYFPLLEELSDRIEKIKRDIFLGKEREMVKKIAITKRNILDLGKIIRPQLGVMQRLEKRVNFFKPEEKMANKLEDLTEKANEAWTALENVTDTIRALERTNNSLIQHKTNDIIIILTIFSVIMLPLTFIVSIYGMNVPWMPYFDKPYAFWIICGIMLAVTLGMLVYFKKRRWM